MRSFQLHNESAYVVPAMRRTLKTDEVKTLSVLSVLVLLAHGALGFLLVRTLSQVPDLAWASIEETQVQLRSESTTPQEQVDSMPPHQPATPMKKFKGVTPSQPSAQSIAQHKLPRPTADKPVVNPTHDSSAASSQSAATGSSTQSDAQSNSPSANPIGGTAANGTSAQTCSALTSFNRRYPGVLNKSSTVTLRISRNAQGAVTSASIINGSGNVALDQFALNSARYARFKRNDGCDSRSFVLPILFQPKN